jgi:hypothetical protein
MAIAVVSRLSSAPMKDRALLISLLLVTACGPGGRDDTSHMSPDAGVGPDASGGGGGGGGEAVYVYAHTASTLYRVDPDTLAVTQIAPFGWGSVGFDQMTDLAIDKTGQMIGVSFTRVYRVDPATAQTTLLSSSLSGTFNGLSFVPASMVGQSGDDVLVGTRNADGKVFRIDPMTGAAIEVGNMGSFQSSGDLVAVAGATLQTVTGSGGGDRLARLSPQTFAATPVGSGTGYGEIWGVAYWKDKVYGFTNNGHFLLIDPTTGVATMVSQTPGIAWWGAAVTTLAPVLE